MEKTQDGEPGKHTGNIINCPIYQITKKNPQLPAIISDQKNYTYAELDKILKKFQTHLNQTGIHQGMRIGLPISDGISLILMMVAIWRIGAIAVPIDPRIPDTGLNEISNTFNLHVILSKVPLLPEKGNQKYSSSKASNVPVINLDREATLILTSGSTGTSKAVLHTFGNHYYSALGANENIPLEPGNRWLASLPFFHVGGLAILIRCFLTGATVVIPGKNQSLIDLIETHRITHLSLVSTQLKRLLTELEKVKGNLSKKALPSLKAILLGGSRFQESMIRKALNFSLPVHTTYGSSEMSSQVTTTPPNASIEELLSSGKCLRHRKLKIDGSGEILVSGNTRFMGYWQKNGLLKPFIPDGWFATGDLGYIDDKKNLHVTGRKDNMFISGGENIMPEEIENCLIQFTGIENALVVPVKDEEFGFRPVVFIKIATNRQIKKETLMEFLEARLPRFKIPDIFYSWPENSDDSFKIKRPEFSNRLENPHTLRTLFTK
jgi:O-succinylbenzoic acid--CoA ligase